MSKFNAWLKEQEAEIMKKEGDKKQLARESLVLINSAKEFAELLASDVPILVSDLEAARCAASEARSAAECLERLCKLLEAE